jgi:site-specific recombinase XerD
LLGHGSISTTEKYLHLNREALETAILSDPLSRAKMVESRRKQTAR